MESLLWEVLGTSSDEIASFATLEDEKLAWNEYLEPLLVSQILRSKGKPVPVVPQLCQNYVRLWLCKSEKRPRAEDLMKSLGPLILQYSSLLLLSNDLGSSKDEAVALLETLESTSYKDALFFLSHFTRSRSKSELHKLCQVLLKELMRKMSRQNLTTEDCTKPIQALNNLLSLRVFRIYFVVQKHFISPWLNNGLKVQKDSPLAIFMRLTSLPDEPEVGDKFFYAVQQRPPLDILASFKTIFSRLDKSRDLMRLIFEKLMADTFCKSAVLSWVSSLLISNMDRGKMRQTRLSISQDGFLLNLISVLLSLLEGKDLYAIDPWCLVLESRVDQSLETRVACSSDYLAEMKASPTGRAKERVHTSDINDRKYLTKSLHSSHRGIICDKCRTKDISGPRFKCANCKDYDLCSTCEEAEFDEMFSGLPKSGVTFQCPLPGCLTDGFSEKELYTHMEQQHHRQLERDGLTLLLCPICAVNADTGVASFSGPELLPHFRECHSLEHDPASHVFIKIYKMVPHHKTARFASLDVVPHLEQPKALKRSEHVGHTCASCDMSPIAGTRYTCLTCPNYSLCPSCEETCGPQHDPTHSFLKIRFPVAGTYSRHDSLYPRSLATRLEFSRTTELTFMSLYCMHIGLIRTISRYFALVQSMENEQSRSKLDSMNKIKLCVDAQLQNPSFVQSVLTFYCRVAQWALSLIQGKETPPTEFRVLPEYIFDDMSDFVMFLYRFQLQVLSTNAEQLKPVILLFNKMLSNVAFANNPYMRAKLVEVFVALAPVKAEKKPELQALSRFFHSNEDLVEHLFPSVLTLFASVEETGTESQFYDKFNVRFVIGRLIKSLAVLPAHRNRLQRLIVDDLPLCLRLVNCMMNDLIYLVDEALIKAAEMEQGVNDSTSLFERERIQRNLKTVAILAGNCVGLVWILTSEGLLRSVFLRPEMRERIASSVNYYATHLSNTDGSAKYDALKIQRFESLRWLCYFVDIFLHLAGDEDFQIDVAKDERSFNPDLFRSIVDTVHNHASRIGTPEDGTVELFLEREALDGGGKYAVSWSSEKRERIIDFIELTKSLAAHHSTAEQDLGSIPDEFLDPILHTIMQDPVVLPTSGVTMDRAVICRHLLSIPNDPFNRRHLNADMLIPNDELRFRIEAFYRREE